MIIIPCLHQQGDRRAVVPNYYPLSEREIEALLQEARTSDNPLTSHIQVRLGQGVWGMTCPQLMGEPFERLLRIDDLYMANLRKGPNPALVSELYRLMTG